MSRLGVQEVPCLSEGAQPPSTLAFLQTPQGCPPRVWGHTGDGTTELQGMGLSQRVRDKQGWWGRVVGTLLSQHPHIPF